MTKHQVIEELYEGKLSRTVLKTNGVRESIIEFNSLPKNVKLEQKYRVETLGLKPFHASKPMFDFIDTVAKVAWANVFK